MPSSRPNTIPTVVHLLRQIKPRSILDVGVGFGKWGHLFREYTDILEAERDPSRYHRENWQVKIDGIEGHAPYLTEMHRYLYNHIHVGDACELIRTLSPYDLIFLGDVIEHLDKGKGWQFLQAAWELCAKAVIISTPKHDTGQTDLCANELERHRSLWAPVDFHCFKGAITQTIDSDTLLAVLPKPGLPQLICKPPTRPGPRETHLLQSAKAAIARLAPSGEKFIFIDDEHLRSELPTPGAIPFLEKDGQYWGPPPDDETAIRELERHRNNGAGYVVILWSSAWWLEHYAGFHQYLLEKFRQVPTGEELIVFDLKS